MVYSPINPWTFPVNPNFPWLPKANTITSITQADPCVITTSSAHGYSDGLIVRVVFPRTLFNSFGMSQINARSGAILVLSPTTFSFPISTLNFDPFGAGNSAITNITQASQAVVTVSTANFVIGQTVIIYGISGMVQVNNHQYIVVAVSGSTITLGVDSTSFTAYSSGGTAKNVENPQIIPIGNLDGAPIADDFTQVNPPNPSTLEQVVIFQKKGLQAGGPCSPS